MGDGGISSPDTLNCPKKNAARGRVRTGVGVCCNRVNITIVNYNTTIKNILQIIIFFSFKNEIIFTSRNDLKMLTNALI